MSISGLNNDDTCSPFHSSRNKMNGFYNADRYTALTCGHRHTENHSAIKWAFILARETMLLVQCPD